MTGFNTRTRRPQMNGGRAGARAARLVAAALLAALAAVLLAARPAAAAPAARYDARATRAAHGAYLGCFNTAALKLAFGGAPGAAACAPRCAAARMPLYAVDRGLRCACAAALPAPEARLPDAACDDPGSAAGAAVPLFYAHADKGKACALRRLRLDAGNFDAAYNAHNALFAGDEARLRMDGHDGTRVTSRAAMLYGMLSFKARVSGEPGVITAAYVSGARRARAGGGGCLARAAAAAPAAGLLLAVACGARPGSLGARQARQRPPTLGRATTRRSCAPTSARRGRATRRSVRGGAGRRKAAHSGAGQREAAQWAAPAAFAARRRAAPRLAAPATRPPPPPPPPRAQTSSG